MSLFGALSASLTNLTAQSSAVNVISNNIANLNTRGFKNSETSFSTLVTGQVGGGVLQRVRQDIGSQGAIQATNVGTDLAVQGRGFFVVKDLGGNIFYTRAGSFRTDSTGNLVNESGYILQGWPLDGQGRLPGEAGNTTNTRSNQDLASVTNVSTSDITGKASPTKTITTKLNLNAGEAVLEGAGGSTAFTSGSSNGGISASSIIVPTAASAVTEGASDTTAFGSGSANNGISSSTIIVPNGSFAAGATVDVRVNSNTSSAGIYTYGGFNTSVNLGTTTTFGANSATAGFTGLTDGDSFTLGTTTTLTTPVTFTYRATSPNVAVGEFSNMNDLRDAMNAVTGLSARVVNNQLFVAPTNANEGMTFTNVSGGIPAGLGLTGTSASTNRFATLENLANLVNSSSVLSATIASASSNATLKISNSNYVDNIQFSSTDTDLLTELGLSTTSIPSPFGFVPGSTITVTTNSGNTIAGTYTYGGFTNSINIDSKPVFGASNTNQTFTGLTDGETFTINTSSLSAPVTFTYKTSATPSARQFSNLSQLAEAINSVTGLSARVINNSLYVSPANAQDAMTFTNGTGNTHNIVTGLGLSDTVAASGRFSSLQGLNNLVNASNGISGTITSATSNASLRIYNDDPTQTVQFSASDADLLAGLGLDGNQVNSVYAPESTAGGRSIASGNISGDFSRTITVYTSLGNPLDLRLAFVKVGTNKWGVELFAADPTQVSAGYPNGLLGFGTVQFNSDGSLNSITSDAQDGAKITGDIVITPTGGASQQSISLSLGSAGALGTVIADGLSQFTGAYTVDRVAQDGAPTGRLQSLQIDAQGFVTAVFDNSLTQRVYKLPVAYMANPNGLQPESGNAYSNSRAAGEITLGQVGNPSVGSIVPGALEVSNSDLGKELTSMITTQQAYSASSNVIRKINDLFEELRNL